MRNCTTATVAALLSLACSDAAEEVFAELPMNDSSMEPADTPDTNPGSATNGSSGNPPEEVATDDATDFTLVFENRAQAFNYPASGTFDTPVGASEPGPIGPGGAYQFRFRAAPGYPGQMGTTRLSFATMFVPSNDLFIAPNAEGIPLFDPMGAPRSGDLSAELRVWDAGTEANEPLGGDSKSSPNQKPNQSPDAEDVGPADTNRAVRLASADYDNVPNADRVASFTLAVEEVNREYWFTATLTNVSSAGTISDAIAFEGAVPMSPGVWVVHNQSDSEAGPLFTEGEPDRNEGLGDIAKNCTPQE